MGVPDRPSPGKHGLAGSAGGQGQPRDGVPPILRYIPAFWNSLDPASLAKQGGQRGEGGGRREGIWDSLPPPRNIYFTPKKNPAPPNPIPNNAFPSVADLSPTVFRDEPFKKTETFQEEGEEDLKPSFPF